MSTNTADLRASRTPKGVRIHKATCKKTKSLHRLGTIPTEELAEAKSATCCRPKGAEEIVQEAVEAREKFRAKVEAEPTPAKETERPAEEPKTRSVGASKRSKTLLYEGAQHWYRAVVSVPSRAAAERLGLLFDQNAKERTVTFTGDPGVTAQAVTAMTTIWAEVPGWLKEFKRSDKQYQSMPKTGSANRRTYAYLAQNLEAFAVQRVGELLSEIEDIL